MLITARLQSETRIRLFFESALGVAAFSPSWFSVTSDDGASPELSVVAALAVPGSAGAVELVVSEELVPSSLYTIDIADGLPPLSGDPLEAMETQIRTPGPPAAKTSRGTLLPDIFGEDLEWRNGDWALSASGDLARIGGEANLKQAMNRRLTSEGLGWDPSYGLKARQHLDQPELGLAFLHGRVAEQLYLDDRIAEVRVDSDDSTIVATYQPIGSRERTGEAKVQIGRTE